LVVVIAIVGIGIKNSTRAALVSVDHLKETESKGEGRERNGMR
jgi:hypothetical protein